jgi:hypothetical protein
MTDPELIEHIDRSTSQTGRQTVLVGELSEMSQVNLDILSTLFQRRPDLRQRWNVIAKKNCKKGGRRKNGFA